jgi:hypothetical protein
MGDGVGLAEYAGEVDGGIFEIHKKSWDRMNRIYRMMASIRIMHGWAPFVYLTAENARWGHRAYKTTSRQVGCPFGDVFGKLVWLFILTPDRYLERASFADISRKEGCKQILK